MKKTFSTIALSALLVPQLGAAQSLQDFENAGRTDMRAMAGITIPLASGRQSDAGAPRLDFTVESARMGQNASFDHEVRTPAVIGWNPDRKSTLSFTLEQRPKLMLNGQKMATFGPSIYADEEDSPSSDGDGGGVSAGVIIGVGLAVLVGVVLIGVDDIQDDFDNLVPDG